MDEMHHEPLLCRRPTSHESYLPKSREHRSEKVPLKKKTNQDLFMDISPHFPPTAHRKCPKDIQAQVKAKYVITVKYQQTSCNNTLPPKPRHLHMQRSEEEELPTTTHDIRMSTQRRGHTTSMPNTMQPSEATKPLPTISPASFFCGRARKQSNDDEPAKAGCTQPASRWLERGKFLSFIHVAPFIDFWP